MIVGEYCNRDVVIAEKKTEIREAARLMREFHVGDLVVVEGPGETNVPVGIVTDRDLVVEVLAEDVRPESVTVGDVMRPDPATAREQDDFWDTLTRMRNLGVRRMPIVDARGDLVGILAVDDFLEVVAEGIDGIVRLIKREMEHETHERP